MNMKEQLKKNSENYLRILCKDIPDRSVGSEGNREATQFFRDSLDSLDWETESREFEATDWKEGGASLKAGGMDFRVLVSPYSLGCSVKASLKAVSSIEELEKGDFGGIIIFLHGEIASEQIMPKNFVFYNPESHQKIVALLEKSGAAALVCATGRNAALAGGVYPFPLFEDGDFDIPSVYMTAEEGEKLMEYAGQEVELISRSERIPGKGYNITGKKGYSGKDRIVITAHIDAKKGTPGAIDNATGVIILLLLAELLRDYEGSYQLELVAFNGEDYYSVPGQMAYIMDNADNFDSIAFNINIDGAGYKQGGSAFSFYNLPEEILDKAREVIQNHPAIKEGVQWAQGDHGIFLHYGRPALAVSSEWFIDHIDNQDITHTPKDNPSIVDCSRVVEIALALNDLIRSV